MSDGSDPAAPGPPQARDHEALSDHDALIESHARYRGLLEAAPDAMVVVDENGDILLMNLQAERQFGYRRTHLVGLPVTTIIPEGFAARLVADDRRTDSEARAQQIGTGLELIGRRQDGSEFPIEIMLSPLDGAAGTLVTAAIRDITTRKAAETELLQAQKLESLGRLAGGIAHDFNNMLFVIVGHAEMLSQDLAPDADRVFDPARARSGVKAIEDAAQRAAALTARLLAFSRQQVVMRRPLDLDAAVERIEPMLDQLIGGGVRLALRLGAPSGHIRADAGQIDQIIVNLVVNARDAMPDGGVVTIATEDVEFEARDATPRFAVTPGRYVGLTVTDTGVGMDKDTLEHAFEPFFTTKEVGRGTGLGLAMTYGIVREGGGHIWVYSEPGMGTVFKLYFPRVEAGEEPQVQVASPPPARGDGRVLVVEDDPAVREVIANLLGRAGFDVVAVADGSEAIARTKLDGPFDSMVTDVVLPGTSGIELATLMMDRDPLMGVVLLSGFTVTTRDLQRVLADGVTFVSKPIASGPLLQAVLGSVATRRSAALPS